MVTIVKNDPKPSTPEVSYHKKKTFTPIPSPTPDKKDTNNYHTHNFDSKYFDTVPLLTNKARYYSYNIATTGL